MNKKLNEDLAKLEIDASNFEPKKISDDKLPPHLPTAGTSHCSVHVEI